MGGGLQLNPFIDNSLETTTDSNIIHSENRSNFHKHPQLMRPVNCRNNLLKVSLPLLIVSGKG